MKQANVQIAAPGFLGVNKEMSPVELSEKWASIADNCVLDSSGRIASRKGYRIMTADNSALGSSFVNEMHEARYADGTVKKFAVGNNKLFTFDDAGALTDITPGGATISADDWQIVTLNDDTYFFQADHEPIIHDNSTGNTTLASAHANVAGTAPEADVATAAFGRIWASGVDGDEGRLYWSDLLIPAAWTGGSSGSLDLTLLWPTGNDRVTAIAAHNNKIIIFGRHSILVFGSSAYDGRFGNPNTDILLEDTIVEIGCISKYGTAVVGNDLWFVDDTGIRTLGRTLQEKSLPIGDITANVRTLFTREIRLETNKVRLFYDPDEAFVLCVLKGTPHVYCFDTRFRMQDGSARTTMWTGLDFSCFMRSADGTIWIGDTSGINKYTGYVDGADSLGVGGEMYRIRYYFHPQDFGVPANLKVPKEVDFVIAGGSLQKAIAFWGYDYTYLFKSQTFILDAVTPDFYNIDEFNITTSDDPEDPTEYGSGGGIGRYTVPLSGSGCNIIIGCEVEVEGEYTAFQEINIQTKIGRMV